MPYKCSKCGAEITEEQVAKTVEKFGKALCNKCILDNVELEGAPSAPDEITGWTQADCKNLFGHLECLEGVRR